MVQHASKYLVFQALTMGASLITFPLITRLFSPEGYGNFALANTTIAFVVALSKCGLSTAFARNYPAYVPKDRYSLYASSFWSQTFTASALTAAYVLGISATRDLVGDELADLLLLIAPLCVFKSLEVLLLGFFRSEERIGAYNMSALAFRLGSAFGGIGTAYFAGSGVKGFFIGMMALEGFLVFSLVLARKSLFSPAAISFSLSRKLFRYGAPLIIFELASLIVSMGDRYQIKYYLGAEPLGIYSAGYNLSMYVQQMLTAPLWMAIFPIYTRIFEEEGKEATTEFLQACLKYYFLLAIPLFAGVCGYASDIILILAGGRYSGAASVVPFVLGATLLHGAYHIVSAGLYLKNKTNIIAIFTFFSAFLNLTMNIYLIPRYGFIGAAYSTFISYVLLIMAITFKSYFFLPISFPYPDILKYSFIAFLSYLPISIITKNSSVYNSIFWSLFSSFIYLLINFYMDKNLISFVSRVKHSFSK